MESKELNDLAEMFNPQERSPPPTLTSVEAKLLINETTAAISDDSYQISWTITDKEDECAKNDDPLFTVKQTSYTNNCLSEDYSTHITLKASSRGTFPEFCSSSNLQKSLTLTEAKQLKEAASVALAHHKSRSTSQLCAVLSENSLQSSLLKEISTRHLIGYDSRPTLKPTRTSSGVYNGFTSLLDLRDAMEEHTVGEICLTNGIEEKTKEKCVYKNLFADAQREGKLCHPSLPQPSKKEELIRQNQVQYQANSQSGDDFCDEIPLLCSEMSINKKQNNRRKNEMELNHAHHRFCICADTQFGILMDGIPMEVPNWDKEMDISRRAVEKINEMFPLPRFVTVCGDLVDTEASFHVGTEKALPSWKKMLSRQECDDIQEQQNRDFQRIWSKLDSSIALVCLCGNHDVGNRPTVESVSRFNNYFGSDYLAFWSNATYNIMLNNCLFFDPSGAPELYDKQLQWLEDRLLYANRHGANHIFVFGHYPWFLYDEEENMDTVKSKSTPPKGWGPPGVEFPDFYFHIKNKYRSVALSLFEKYNVKACFGGHFHQNLVSRTKWGMEMIVTGPLSMMLHSNSASTDSDGLGVRVVDVSRDCFSHKFLLL